MAALAHTAGASAPVRETLFDIEQRIEIILECLENAETPEEHDRFEAELQEYIEAEVRKADGITFYIRFCQHKQDCIDEAIDLFKTQKALYKAREERVRSHSIYTMQRFGHRKLVGLAGPIRIQPCQPSVVIDPGAEIPPMYLNEHVTYTPDKTGLRQAIEAGAEFPGIRLITDRWTLVVPKEKRKGPEVAS